MNNIRSDPPRICTRREHNRINRVRSVSQTEFHNENAFRVLPTDLREREREKRTPSKYHMVYVSFMCRGFTYIFCMGYIILFYTVKVLNL